MNEARRKELNKARGMLEEAKAIIEAAGEEEREYFDNMPENMQSGDKGSKAGEASVSLEEAASELDDIISKIEEASA